MIALFLIGKASAKAISISPHKKKSNIEYGYWKCGTHARVLQSLRGSAVSEPNFLDDVFMQ